MDDIDRQAAAVLVAALIAKDQLGVNFDREELWEKVAEYQLDMAEALARVRQDRGRQDRLGRQGR
jgi:hypothetical protein